MQQLNGKDWAQTTALNAHQAPVGIDLFSETAEDGTPMTAIYERYANGTRWPARTVNMAEKEHAKNVLDAWERKHPAVTDYRT